MSYDNELRGVLFKNKEKRPDKKDPDYRGNVTANGVDYWLDAWINEPKAGGEKYMSLRLKEKDGPAERKAKQEKAAPEGGDPFSDEIPF